MTSAIRAQREAEDGFTLIELLVVVIIIGILAAIAIPAFLNQRERAWQAELTSAVRNGALDVEAEATAAGGTYPGTWANAADFTYTELTFTYTPAADNTDFCLSGTDTRINSGVNHVTYQASTGGLNDFAQTAGPTCTIATP